ncbi:beta-phosphoglucomutase [Peribacillus sp. NPDC096379]|uniref:beta-phosphoglucomutase n=1 Tax=Peribacillus sp. NPDC096379 TaxID=3364393 RepID=UPI00380BCDCE
MSKQAVIFDLDGVIVSTDEFHYLAWKEISDKENIYFDKSINERLRGVSRMESLEIILKKANKVYSTEEKELLTSWKNEVYRRLLDNLSPEDILPGVLILLKELQEQNVRIAIGSSSKNARFILDKIKLANHFDAIADGNSIQKSKPNPEVFLLAARQLGIDPHACVVVEDAEAGIDAGLTAGMKTVGVGSASLYSKAHIRVEDLVNLNILKMLED